MRASSRPPAPLAEAIVVGDCEVALWSVAPAERLRRQFVRARAAPAGRGAPRVALFRADCAFDDALVRGLVAARADAALADASGRVVAASVAAAAVSASVAAIADGRAPDGVATVAAATLADGYDGALRKREPPYLLPIRADERAAIERRIFGGAYKGVTDLVTLYVWPAPARAATRWCARLGITPNQVTFASLLLVLAAMALFWNGRYGAGLVAAWAMTFLDTVDGKLARVTVTSSRLGDVFDHGIDLIHPPFWWWAWIVGLPAAGHPLAGASIVLAVIVGGYLLQRLEEGVFIACFGIDMHTWQRFDSKFRLVTARRNPNLLILTAFTLVGRPDLGIATVAVWVAFSLAVHGLRLLQAALAKRRGPVRSWLSAPA